jgi:hypothetical protein
MTYHIVFNRPVGLAAVRAGAADGLNPRHSMVLLADRLNAIVHDGSDVQPTAADKLIARATRTQPLWWAIARKLRRDVKAGDVIYCTGEDVGVPVAALCGRRVPVAMMAHYVDRVRGRIALSAFGMKRRGTLFLTVAQPQAEFLRRFLALPETRARFVWDQTDTTFFSPGSVSPNKTRPIVMSVGLEKRDYGTLARATGNLDIDVRISGYSADTRVLSRAFPDTMPDNMCRRFYSWPDLQQLYRDADIAVVSVFPNNYAAGVQALMEALASGCPVIVTASEGLTGYLDHGGVRAVPPGDASAMREAITELLADRPTRDRMASVAAAVARDRHPVEAYVETIAVALEALADPKRTAR